MAGSITDVKGITVGHATDEEARTGCTVVLLPQQGAMAGIHMGGAAPATRETNLLRIDGITRRINAVLLTGGSAFGLDAAGGVLRWLEEHGYGFDAAVARVPLVPTLSLFDLAVGNPDIRPNAEMGYEACSAARVQTKEGPVGAGCGATVGKVAGPENISRSGIGTVSLRVGEVTVGVIAVSNAFGDIRDEGGKIIAGAINPESGSFLDTDRHIIDNGPPSTADPFANCTFAVVAVDMALDRRMANRLAEMASAGISRAVSPAHTIFDFDAVIAVGTGNKPADPTAVGAAAARGVHQAIIRGASGRTTS
jgi:L-aminopeptidase/D-esterase-like protein